MQTVTVSYNMNINFEQSHEANHYDNHNHDMWLSETRTETRSQTSNSKVNFNYYNNVLLKFINYIYMYLSLNMVFFRVCSSNFNMNIILLLFHKTSYVISSDIIFERC